MNITRNYLILIHKGWHLIWALMLFLWLYHPVLPCWRVKFRAVDLAQLRAVGVWYVIWLNSPALAIDRTGTISQIPSPLGLVTHGRRVKIIHKMLMTNELLGWRLPGWSIHPLRASRALTRHSVRRRVYDGSWNPESRPSIHLALCRPCVYRVIAWGVDNPTD